MGRRINVFEIGTFDSVGSKIDMNSLSCVGEVPISREAGVWNELIDMLNVESLGCPSSDICYRRKRDHYLVYVERGN
jgi:hypothetical protein